MLVIGLMTQFSVHPKFELVPGKIINLSSAVSFPSAQIEDKSTWLIILRLILFVKLIALNVLLKLNSMKV